MKFTSPVYNVIAVPFEKVIPNTYNPNKVAPPEFKLLYKSIKEDGYTMPIVCYHSEKDDTYIIVDGFHRYRVMKEYHDIYERENGMLPVTVINKPIENRMASTVRHNRARGNHDVDLMGNIVKSFMNSDVQMYGYQNISEWIRTKCCALNRSQGLLLCSRTSTLARRGSRRTVKTQTMQMKIQSMRKNFQSCDITSFYF